MGTGELTFVTEAVLKFGKRQAAENLAEVVLDLFDASLRASTKRTYKTGQRAYDHFVRTLAQGVRLPFQNVPLSETELKSGILHGALVIAAYHQIGKDDLMLRNPC